MGFRDFVVERKIDESNKVILLNTEKALNTFIKDYKVGIDKNNIPVGQWFIYTKFLTKL